MELAWFVYTVAVMLVSVAACAVSLMMWVLTSRRLSLVAAGVFAAYVIEVSVIFFGEYQGDKPFMSEYFQQGLAFPLPTVVTSVVLVTLTCTWVALRVHARVGVRHVVAFAVAFGTLSVLTAPTHGHAGTLRTIVFWGLRDVVLIGSLLGGYLFYRLKASESERSDIERLGTLFKIILVLSLCMLAEDVYNIVFARPDVTDPLVHDFFWHLTERNLSENAILLVCSVWLVRSCREEMRVFARHPAEALEGRGPYDLSSDIDARLPRFCDECGMSRREREVLRLALLGRSTQEIANDLVISLGTVKAHLHRIYSKAQVSNRRELATAFWRF